jgi:hypothetical protein
MSRPTHLLRGRHASAEIMLLCRDSSSQHGYQTEEHSEDDGDAEEQFVNTAPRLEDGTSAAKDTTQPGATCLKQNRDSQGNAQNDLDYLKIL